MHDAARVRVGQRVAQRHADAEHVAVAQRTVVEEVAERVAADELGDEVDGVLVAARLVERDDRRVRQPRRGERLALGALAAPPASGIRLTATGRSSRRSRASQTVPNPPAPRRSTSS